MDLKNNAGETCFSLARHANAGETMEILLAKGASCDTESSDLLKEAINQKLDGLAAQVRTEVRSCNGYSWVHNPTHGSCITSAKVPRALSL